MKTLVTQTALFLSLLMLPIEIHSQNKINKVKAAVEKFCERKGISKTIPIISVKGDESDPDNLFIEMGYDGIIGDKKNTYTPNDSTTVQLIFLNGNETFARFTIDAPDIKTKQINFQKKE